MHWAQATVLSRSTTITSKGAVSISISRHGCLPPESMQHNTTGKLVGVIGDEDTVTGFLLAGVGHRTTEGANFLVVKPGG